MCVTSPFDIFLIYIGEAAIQHLVSVVDLQSKGRWFDPLLLQCLVATGY